mgnify:CR=1 FL=1
MNIEMKKLGITADEQVGGHNERITEGSNRERTETVVRS